MNYSKYNKSRLNNILSGMIPVVISFFTKRDKDFIVLNSFHNIQFNDNTRYLFLYLIKNTNYKVKFVLNDDEARSELTKEYGDYFIETYSFKGKMNALKARTWIVNAFEFPVGGFFMRFRRNIIHLTHGMHIKNAGLGENDLSFVKKLYYKLLRTNITYTLATSEFFRDYTKKYLGVKDSQIIINGYPRYDFLTENKTTRNDGVTKILYAPTWRHYSDVELFPFSDFNLEELEKFCTENKVEINIRVHPRFEDKIPQDLLKSKCIVNYSSSIEPDINNSLHKFDMMITDYSSILYDFYLLNRPVFYFDYDKVTYEEKVGFAVDYDIITVGYHPKTMKEFFECILDGKEKDSYANKRNEINILCNNPADNNSRNLISKLFSLGVLEGE